jgi:hypothetical protein
LQQTKTPNRFNKRKSLRYSYSLINNSRTKKKLSKIILIIIFLKLILDIYLGTIVLIIPNFLLVINIISKTPNKTKNSSISIILFELFILFPSINF